MPLWRGRSGPLNRVRDRLALLKPVRLLAMDVDGVLTDGTLGYDDAGVECKRFHVADGMGLTAVRLAGIEIVWLSGRTSVAVKRRASELRIPTIIQDVVDKGKALQEMMELKGVSRDAVAYVGDDWNDLPAFDVAAVRIAVRDADEIVRRAADLITDRPGGHGAIREVCDALLEAQGATAEVMARYLASLKDVPVHGISGQ